MHFFVFSKSKLRYQNKIKYFGGFTNKQVFYYKQYSEGFY